MKYSKRLIVVIEQTCLIMKSIVKKVEGDTANHFQNCTGGWTNPVLSWVKTIECIGITLTKHH